ncbi:MAG: excinuclease ABC subunit UvrB [Patescibacteria group bacterium]|nr:excinuclease ABC subunit UvrB [Patescibacteria group bacterium]
MAIFKLKSSYKPQGDQPRAIAKLVEGLKKRERFQTLLGVTGSGKTFTMANVISHFDMPVLVLAPNKTLAAQLYREYKNLFPENSVNYFVSYYDYYQPEAYLAPTDTYIEKEAMINEEIDRLRHQATSALQSRRDVIVVASVSCIYNLGLPVNYAESALRLEVGKPMVRGDLTRQLVKVQFERTNGILKRGFFRVRGDVIEIAPASGEVVYRIELSGQKISNIFVLDQLSQKIIEKPKELVIFPPKHFISDKPQIREAIKEIKKELNERLKYFEENGLYLEAERLKRRTLYDTEMLESIGYCHGIENYSRHLTGKLAGEAPDTLLSYFPRGAQTNAERTRTNAEKVPSDSALSQREFANSQKADFLTIIDESHLSVPQVRGMYEGDRSRKESLIQYGWRLPSALDNRPLKFEEFEKRIGQVIFTSATPGVFEFSHSARIAEQIIRPTGLIDPPVEVRPVFGGDKGNGQIEDLMKEIDKITAKGGRVIANTLTKKMAEDLTDFLLKKGIKANFMHSDTKTLDRSEIITDFRKNKFNVLVGVNLLREGLDLPEVELVAILDADREGFLRSETSLMQTMGRTARNVNGRVIIYADKITDSIKKSVKEVERRRKIQTAYNKEHGIKPESIKKKIERFIEISSD